MASMEDLVSVQALDWQDVASGGPLPELPPVTSTAIGRLRAQRFSSSDQMVLYVLLAFCAGARDSFPLSGVAAPMHSGDGLKRIGGPSGWLKSCNYRIHYGRAGRHTLM